MRLYKAVITDIPDAAKVSFTVAYPGIEYETAESLGFHTWDEAGELVQDSDWEPEGWRDFIDERAAGGDSWAVDCQDDSYAFFWPKISGEYKSASTAREKAKLAERWGATVTIFEAEVSPFIPVAEANERRKKRRDAVRIARLQAKIDSIRGTSDGIPF